MMMLCVHTDQNFFQNTHGLVTDIILLFHENDLVALLILKTGENVAAAIVTALLNGISTLLEYPYTPEKGSIETPVKF